MSVLYEPTALLVSCRRGLGWSQGELAKRSRCAPSTISQLENAKTRVAEAKAVRIAAALRANVHELFVCVWTLNRAARELGVPRAALRAAVDDGRLSAHAIENYTRAGEPLTRIYFRPAALPAEYEQLPACVVDDCEARALRGRHCPAHRIDAAHVVARRAVARPLERRSWVVEEEAARLVHRAWETVHAAIAAGSLRSERVGQCVVIAKSDLWAWDQSLPPVPGTTAYVEETEAIVRLYEAGKPSPVIARRARRGETTILRRLERAGIIRRRGGTPRKHPVAEPRECANKRCRRMFVPPDANAARGDGNFCSPSCSLTHAWTVGVGAARSLIQERGRGLTRQRYLGAWASRRPPAEGRKPRGRPEKELTREQLETIARLTAAGWGIHSIAKQIPGIGWRKVQQVVATLSGTEITG